MTRRGWLAGLSLVGLLGCGGSVEDADLASPSVEGTEQEILGGSVAARHQFPYQVRIMVQGVFTCGGTLTKAGWVVTAAHCVEGIAPSAIRVIAGDLLLSTLEADEQVRTVSRKVIHPSYVATEPLHDVALLQLAQPFALSAAVQPLALPTAPAPLGQHTASGWGATQTGPTSNALKYTKLNVVGPASCQALVGSGHVASAELCATPPNGSTNVCHRDDGGPLVLGGRLYGILSWHGSSQCDTFSVFTNVFTYVPWIQSHTG
ncbi:serine protease [Corallococcus sp. bb12-1]|uniref:serine protease n=1 Tax=Corallococcus sp. bb12-1 TaxID=2996784 RepID=UPI00226DE0C5|nr:serine protease [Corallococcus sp. bb12-1]MCY1040805.1 serine protease [Corallococcus sp. bb12-1]